VYRHQRHLLTALSAPVKQKDAGEFFQEDSLLAKIAQLETEARRLGKKAEDAGDLRGAMAAVRELVRIVEVLGKLQGEITEPGGTTVNVVYVNPPSPDLSNRSGPVTMAEEAASSMIVDAKESAVGVSPMRRDESHPVRRAPPQRRSGTVAAIPSGQ
jgi:hypothetical protein